MMNKGNFVNYQFMSLYYFTPCSASFWHVNVSHYDIKEPRMTFKSNSKIPKGQTEIVKSEDREDHGQQNETKEKHRTHNTTLKTKAGITRTLQKPW